ncbi:tyrosine-type recombinase/integrase [Mycobacteroides abscessus subsp. abscessus]|uniref:tyrosine-type recombinase/integrase n=1 Tax=Mycobacteroides abscessus TaxID=36809 RepID=UPI0039EED54F
MSIRKYETKSGSSRYLVEWRLPGRIKRGKVFHTLAEARVFEAEMVASKARGLAVDPRAGSIRLDDVYERWLSTRVDLTPKVRRGYEDCWRISVHPEFGSWPLNALDSYTLQNWVNAMSRGPDAVGPRTQRWRASVLRMVLGYAFAQGWIVKNPALALAFPPLPVPEHTYLTPEELERLAALCGPQGDVILILAYTGLRFGELVGLRVEDVDLEARRIRVRRSITRVGGRATDGRPKSRAGVRTVPIPGRIVSLLYRRIAGRDGADPAVCSAEGALLHRENFVKQIQFNCQRELLGRPKLRLHDLRHTYASLARKAGADLRLLQKTMGHASITMTAHIYADLYDDELDAVADALDTLMNSETTQIPSGGSYSGRVEAECIGQLSIDDELGKEENAV